MLWKFRIQGYHWPIKYNCLCASVPYDLSGVAIMFFASQLNGLTSFPWAVGLRKWPRVCLIFQIAAVFISWTAIPAVVYGSIEVAKSQNYRLEHPTEWAEEGSRHICGACTLSAVHVPTTGPHISAPLVQPPTLRSPQFNAVVEPSLVAAGQQSLAEVLARRLADVKALSAKRGSNESTDRVDGRSGGHGETDHEKTPKAKRQVSLARKTPDEPSINEKPGMELPATEANAEGEAQAGAGANDLQTGTERDIVATSREPPPPSARVALENKQVDEDKPVGGASRTVLIELTKVDDGPDPEDFSKMVQKDEIGQTVQPSLRKRVYSSRESGHANHPGPPDPQYATVLINVSPSHLKEVETTFKFTAGRKSLPPKVLLIDPQKYTEDTFAFKVTKEKHGTQKLLCTAAWASPATVASVAPLPFDVRAKKKQNGHKHNAVGSKAKGKFVVCSQCGKMADAAVNKSDDPQAPRKIVVAKHLKKRAWDAIKDRVVKRTISM
eukprot:GHVT01069893.1.p1 GENE.GHVT01069893.1~~GHVT01069893.1.p1  ORF type:complete len:496 (+),score=46.58 GHVT01069893.1:139-1626(+)